MDEDQAISVSEQIKVAYEQLKNDPSLVFVHGEYQRMLGIYAWETYTGLFYCDKCNEEPVLVLCFVPEKVHPITIKFYQFYVSATPDRVALVAFDPTRNITGGYANIAQVLSEEDKQRVFRDWVKDFDIL